MTTPSLNKYLVNEMHSKDDAFVVEAAKVELDEQSGKLKFLDADGNLVALYINATFRKQTA